MTAVIVADSVGPACVRLVSVALTFPRIILPEVLTHRAWARNTSSSRAVPVTTALKRLLSDPFVPRAFYANKKGMSGGDGLAGWRALAACGVWLAGMGAGVATTYALAKLGVHKQHANRPAEPYAHVTMLVTATDWDGFFEQRDHPSAMPEIQVLARALKAAMRGSGPEELEPGEWHLPYVSTGERARYALHDQRHLSVGRCCRVSYGRQGGGDADSDIALGRRLEQERPPHWSPLEHQAVACLDGARYANLRGWRSYRNMVEHV